MTSNYSQVIKQDAITENWFWVCKRTPESDKWSQYFSHDNVFVLNSKSVSISRKLKIHSTLKQAIICQFFWHILHMFILFWRRLHNVQLSRTNKVNRVSVTFMYLNRMNKTCTHNVKVYCKSNFIMFSY